MNNENPLDELLESKSLESIKLDREQAIALRARYRDEGAAMERERQAGEKAAVLSEPSTIVPGADGLTDAQCEQIAAICDAYESGIGHGLQQDGHSSAQFSDRACSVAYGAGYDEGLERAEHKRLNPPADGYQHDSHTAEHINTVLARPAAADAAALSVAAPTGWKEFAQAFRGAYLNPVARRKYGDEYTEDCIKRFHDLEDAIASRPAAVMAASQEKQTDLAKRLLFQAESVGGKFSAVTVLKSELTAICCEANRYYMGMCDWKATAEAKDAEIVTLRRTAMGAGSLSLDERALFIDHQRKVDSVPDYITDDIIMSGELVKHQWAGWQARAAIVRPTASGAAVLSVDSVALNIEAQLRATMTQRAKLQTTLEIIAVGDAPDPSMCAEQALINAGLWESKVIPAATGEKGGAA